MLSALISVTKIFTFNMKPNAIPKLKQAIDLLKQAQQLIEESYIGDSGDEEIETIDYVIEDLQTDIDLFSEQ